MQYIVLSRVQAGDILTARQAGKMATAVSLDLGLTTTDEVAIEPRGVRFPGGQILAWSDLE